MALGKRRREWQLEAFVVASDLPKSSGHSFSIATASTAHSKAPCSIGRAPSPNAGSSRIQLSVIAGLASMKCTYALTAHRTCSRHDASGSIATRSASTRTSLLVDSSSTKHSSLLGKWS